MKKPCFLPRFLALWLILSLSLPSPAFALRTEQTADKQSGLEELKAAFLSGDPREVIGEVIQVASAALTTPASVSPVPTPAAVPAEFPLAAAGAEEDIEFEKAVSYQTPGEFLYVARMNKEMSLSDLVAKKPGTSKSSLSRYERNLGFPSPKVSPGFNQ